MDLTKAKTILDRVRDGMEYSPFVINQALFLTGDLDEHQYARMDEELRGKRMDSTTQAKG